jgi:hypothetical protein
MALMASAGAPVPAADRGEVQLSAHLGAQNLKVDDEDVAGGERFDREGMLIGAAVAYRLPRGLLFEVSILHSAYSDFFFANVFTRSFDTYQYSGAVGWQFDVNRWRITPKVGAARSKLTSDGPLLFPQDGEESDKLYATVPFVEASFMHRAGRRWAFGVTLRETFEDFGHTRSYGGTAQYIFD